MRGCSSFRIRNVRFRWRFIHAWRGSTRSRKSVRGGAVWVGRTVGAMDGAIKPPWMGLRRVLPTHAAPPPHGMPASAVAVASAGAGRSPAKNHKKKQQAEACCFGVMVRPERFELPTAWFVARYSIQLSYGRQLHKLVVLIVCGAPGEIRTPDRLVRSQVLYPTELRARGTQSNFTALPAADAEGLSSGAPGEIRTPDRLVRSQVLYPTELRAPCDRSGIMRMSARVVNAFVKIFTQLNEKRLCDSLRVFHPREVIGLRTQLLRRKHA